MALNLSPRGLAAAAARNPKRTIGIWLVAIALGVAIVGALFASATTNEQNFTNTPEAERALELLKAAGFRPEKLEITDLVLVEHASLKVDDPAFKAKVDDLAGKLRGLGADKVQRVLTVHELRGQAPEAAASLVSKTGNATVIPVTLAGSVDDATRNIKGVLEIASEGKTGGFEIGVAGAASINNDFQEMSERDLQKGEVVGISAAIVILLLVFGAVGSSWMPIIMAVFAIIMAVAASAIIGQAYKLSFFVINMITMIGLAVGIDYTLMIVARFREERSKGVERVEAVTRAGSTAGRAVLFSGLTVVFALIGLLIVPTTIFFSLALGAILVVIFAIILSLTLLPAILSLMGDRVNAWKLPFLPAARYDYGGSGGGFWNRLVRVVLARPAIFLVATGGALIALTVPYSNINLGFNGVDTLPDNFPSKSTFIKLVRDFPQSIPSPVEIVVSGDAGSQATRDGVARLAGEIKKDTATFAAVNEYQVSEDGRVGLLEAHFAVAADSDAANDSIGRLRHELIPAANIPAEALVSGVTAFNVDFFDLVSAWTPPVFALVLSLSFVLLMVVFRSVVVPVKAILLNLLSVGAAYGLLVLVFQEGFAADILGFQQVKVIEAWLPLFLFSVLFGLSMDYEVFLLSRMRERYDQTGNNEEAVAFGIRSTAGIITGAALIMVAVFAGFALADMVSFQQMGFGLGIAVLVDATIIRSVLVPSTMKLLGKANWYLPKFLAWLPDVRVEVHDQPRAARPAGAPAGGADGKAK
jgi:RND superfamily putative drug exporter